jgi:hypothetical protein
MQKNLFEAEPARRITTTLTSLQSLTVADAARTGLCAIPDIVHVDPERDFEHVAEYYGEIDDESSCTSLSGVDGVWRSCAPIPDFIYGVSQVRDRDAEHIAEFHGDIDDGSSCTSLSYVDAARTRLCAIRDGINCASGISDREVEHVAECHQREIDDESSCKSDANPRPSLGSTQIMVNTDINNRKTTETLLPDQNSLYKDIQNLARREQSLSQTYSSLDECLEMVNDIDINELDFCLKAVQQATGNWDSTLN